MFCRFECRMFYVLYPFVTYLLTLRRIHICRRLLLGKGEVSFSSVGLRILDKMTGES
jgi:hypothetical protein